MNYETLDHIDRLRESKTLNEVVSQFAELVDSYGYDHFLITGVPHPKTRENIKNHTLLNGWSRDWFTRYTEKNYLPDDPVAGHVFETPHAFAWSDVEIDQEENPLAATIMDDARSVGMEEGMVVPIFALSGYQSAVTMAGKSPDQSKASRSMIELASIYAYGRVRQILTQEKRVTRNSFLSPRERECLLWVAKGKSDWEVGEILSLSHYTVKEYVGKATRKMNAVTRTQAVAEAIRRGELTF